MSGAFELSYTVLWTLVVLQTIVLLGVVRVMRHLPAVGRKLGPATVEETIGYRVPDFEGKDLTGRTLSAKALLGRLTGLLFVSADCPSCHAALTQLEGLEHKVPGDIVVICRGDPDACRELKKAYAIEHPMIVDAAGRIARQFGYFAPPTAVVVDASGVVRGVGNPMQPADFEALLASSTVGTEAPGVVAAAT